jgi:hypothetical protein
VKERIMQTWSGKVRLRRSFGVGPEVLAQIHTQDGKVSVEITKGNDDAGKPLWETRSPHDLDPESLCQALATSTAPTLVPTEFMAIAELTRKATETLSPLLTVASVVVSVVEKARDDGTIKPVVLPTNADGSLDCEAAIDAWVSDMKASKNDPHVAFSWLVALTSHPGPAKEGA